MYNVVINGWPLINHQKNMIRLKNITNIKKCNQLNI